MALLDASILPAENGQFTLNGPCVALLSWDEHLVAVGASGQIQVAGLGTAFAQRLTAAGPLTCHPCIDLGTLFLGRAGALTAFSLAALQLPELKTSPRWTQFVAGNPVEALLALEDRLFFTLRHEDGSTDVAVLEGVSTASPKAPITLFRGQRLSTLAANGDDGSVVFLSEENGQIHLHRLDGRRSPLKIETTKIRDLTATSLSRLPISVLGQFIFGTFGSEDRFCQIDSGRATLQLDDDVRRFALQGIQKRLQIETTEISIPPSNHREPLAPFGAVAGEPLILRDFAAVVGFQDGRVVLFDLAKPQIHRDLRIDGGSHGITALASFGPYLAAASSKGTVALFEIKAK
jgi:hypothetical protein